MTAVNKQALSGTPDRVRTMVEYLARDHDQLEYLAGTWLRELAVKLAACEGLSVAAISYDDMAGYELEVTLAQEPQHDPIVIGRSRAGDYCQITLERWLSISSELGIENAAKSIQAILTASVRSDQVAAVDTTTKP